MLTLPLFEPVTGQIATAGFQSLATSRGFLKGWPTDLIFSDGAYRMGGNVVTQAAIAARHSRTGARYGETKAGIWVVVPDSTPAILPGIGYASGEARVNAIGNPLMSGAVPGQTGAGGALPDGWLQGAVAGIDVTVTPITRDGLPALRVRMAGTNTAGSARYPHLYFVTGVTAAPGQDWTLASRIDITDASDLSGLANAEFRAVIQERQGGAYLGNHQSSGFSSPGVHEPLLTATLANANCNQIRVGIALPIAAGGTIDFTLEIVAPRLVQAAYDQGFGVGATAADALVFPAADLGMAVTPSVTGVTALWRGTVSDSASDLSRLFDIAADTANRLGVYCTLAGNTNVMLRSAGSSSDVPVPVLGGVETTIGVTWRADGSFAVSQTGQTQITGTSSPPAGTFDRIGIGTSFTAAAPINAEHKQYACTPESVSDAALEDLVARVAA